MAQNYQDAILKTARRENISVNIYLTNGFQIRGHLRGFDNYVIIMESDGKQQMIYKHAISTIVLQRSIQLQNIIGNDGDNNVL